MGIREDSLSSVLRFPLRALRKEAKPGSEAREHWGWKQPDASQSRSGSGKSVRTLDARSLPCRNNCEPDQAATRASAPPNLPFQ